MSNIKVQGSATGAGNFTLTPPNGGASDRTITLPDRSGTISLLDGPAFRAFHSVATNVAQNTWTKIPLGTVDFDTAGCFSTANSRFQPTTPGYYFFHGGVSANISGGTYAAPAIFKNGSLVAQGAVSAAAGPYASLPVSHLCYMNGTTDYVELYFSHGQAATIATITGSIYSFLSGVQVRVP